MVSSYTHFEVLWKKLRWPRLWKSNLKFKSWTEFRITIIQTERCCCACYGALKDFYCMSGNITDKNTLWQLWTVKQGQEKGFSKACSKLRILILCLDDYIHIFLILHFFHCTDRDFLSFLKKNVLLNKVKEWSFQINQHYFNNYGKVRVEVTLIFITKIICTWNLLNLFS